MKKQRLPLIEIRTMPNGYSLVYDGMKQPCGFFYFDIDTLIEGFFLHIAMKMSDQMDIDTMKRLMEASSNNNDIQKCIIKIDELQNLLNVAKTNRQNMAQRVIIERSKLMDMVKSINMLAQEFRGKSEIANRLSMLTRQYAKTKNLTMKDLGSFDGGNE